jgi:hypothetical protein
MTIGGVAPPLRPDQREIERTPGPPPLGNRALPYAFTIGALLVMVPIGVKGMLEASIAGGFIFMLLLLFVLGLERLGMCLVMVGMFFAPMTAMVLPGASFVTVSDFAIVGAFTLLFPSIIRKRVWVPWQFAVGSMIFFTVSMIASFLVPVPLMSIDLTLRVTAATILLPLAFVWWAPRGRVLYFLVAMYPLGAAFNVTYAVLRGPTLANGRYTGLTEQPTAFGYACLLAICVLPFMFAVLPRGRRWMVFPVGLVLSYGIWISGSRASLLVLIVLAAMFPFLERSIKAAGFIALLGIIGIAMLDRILDQNDGSNALSRLLGSGSGGSDHERLEGLAEAWQVFQQSPIIGNGFEFETFLAHNIYMQVLTCVGIIGFVAFMLILWAFAIPLFTAKAPYRLLAYPAVAYIVVGPITPNLGSRYVGIMLAVSFLGATIGKMGPHDVEPDEEPEAPPAPKHAGTPMRVNGYQR